MTDPVLSVRNLTKRFGGLTAVNAVNWDVYPGEVVALLGDNGAGSIVGTIIGALIIAVLTTGLVMLNVQAFWQFIVVGIVVIVAVLIDQSRDLLIGRSRGGRSQ